MVSTRITAPTSATSRRTAPVAVSRAGPRAGGPVSLPRTHGHGAPHVAQRAGGDVPGLLRTGRERGLEAVLVRPDLGVALAHRRQHRDDRLGRGRLQVAVAAGAGEVGL